MTNRKPPFDSPEILAKVVMNWAHGKITYMDPYFWTLRKALGQVSGETGYWVMFTPSRYDNDVNMHEPLDDWTNSGTFLSKHDIDKIIQRQERSKPKSVVDQLRQARSEVAKAQTMSEQEHRRSKREYEDPER